MKRTLLLLALWTAATTQASSWLDLEIRYFPDGPASPEQAESRPGGSIGGQLQWQGSIAEEAIDTELILFARVDSEDSNRTHADLREASLRWQSEQWRWLAGVSKVFWGAAESVHLVNIVNQVDLVEDPSLEEHLGQPMLSGQRALGPGFLELYALPWFRPREYPANDARLRPPFPLSDQIEYESGAGQRHLDFAARYQWTQGSYDIGLSVFHGTGREPTLRVEPIMGVATIIQRYEQITQLGFDLQGAVSGDWVLKAEGMVREGQGPTFGAFAGGVEYTFWAISEAGADLTFNVEYIYDGRLDGTLDAPAPPALFDNNLFLGARYAFNNFSLTELRAGLYMELSELAGLGVLEFRHRLRDDLLLEGRTAFGNNIPDEPLLAPLREDGFVEVRMKWVW